MEAVLRAEQLKTVVMSLQMFLHVFSLVVQGKQSNSVSEMKRAEEEHARGLYVD